MSSVGRHSRPASKSRERPCPPANYWFSTGSFLGGSLMISSGLTFSVINRARPGDGYVRVRDSGLITAVAQFLYDEAALLDEWRLDEWLALFHPEAARYLIPSPEDL